ncbi:undecaprenyldiphospho-muramoylpentapeptide beta-N-acetylglucosaminyltransferase [Marinicrinis lubricantis]|uniref:UDP-N-acetylglucosamine--N-acetylmuramyl-(pentapeptide) pyrophosphoryl-undecaprenol N-acetylglucosamine transferase n=1 Tax=Marinicrinis lubricantis TaxID=2086470 RepID=A0ABW1ITA9_9BACL
MAGKIMFTGGGTAGHVTVNLALIPRLQQEGWTCEYIGSYEGIEKQLVSQLKDVTYYGISTGKLRRYLDIKNMKDPFRVMKGVMQAYRMIRKSKPDVVFSKGGFVSVPVVLGAWLNRVPAVIHESDLTPGLANKIAMPFAKKICVTFPETMNHVSKDKAVLVGGVIRDELRSGSKTRGYGLCGFTSEKPVILIMGGSQGSKVINEKIRSLLGRLTDRFQIVHICGKNQVDASINNRYYKQFEYVHEELADLLAMTDLVVSRAGSNSIFEFLALRKPMLLIPLSRIASRGDQILNAASFVKSGYAESIQEEELTDERFMAAIDRLYDQRMQYVQQMNKAQDSSVDDLVEMIKQAMK